MSKICEVSQNLVGDHMTSSLRKLSLVLENSVKEMEEDVLGKEAGKYQQQQQQDSASATDYKKLLLKLAQQKQLQDERRMRLSQVNQRSRRNEPEEKEAQKEAATVDKPRRRTKRNTNCYQCGIKVDLDDVTTFAVCRGCDHTICRDKQCSDWDRITGYWECVVCIKNRDSQVRAGEWILDQLNRRVKNGGPEEILHQRDAETQSERSYCESTYSISIEQKAKVREFLEEIISEIVGGSLDEVPVSQLHRSTEYLPTWNHECPGVQHLNLKRFIEKIVAEAVKLPNLFNQSGVPPRPEEHMPFFDPQKYEQLVATAVINKIIETYRNPNNVYLENASSGVHTGSEAENAKSESVASSGKSKMGNHADDMTIDAQSDLDGYLQRHKVPLPDFSATDALLESSAMSTGDSATDDASDCQSVRSSTTGTEGTWEENWLFKKRKLKAETSASIAMLVPSPTEEVKALIGDKNADEISDLSEAEDVADPDSDLDDDESAGGVKELPSVLVQSKTVIGGKNELNSFDDNSSTGDSLVSNPDSGINVAETKNEALISEGDYGIIGSPKAETLSPKIIPVAAPRRKSCEDSVPETVKVPVSPVLVPVNIVQETEQIILRTDENNNSTGADDIGDQLIPGSIAEREHLKWLTATAEIPNNPYSPEALQKRLQNGSTTSILNSILSSSSNSGGGVGGGDDVQLASMDNFECERDVGEEVVTEKEVESTVNAHSNSNNNNNNNNEEQSEADYVRYGRDYYINDAKRASGTRKKSTESVRSQNSTSTPTTPPPPKQQTDEDENKPLQWPQTENAERLVVEAEGGRDDKNATGDIFIAKPIMVEVDDEICQNPISLAPSEEEATSAISTDADTTTTSSMNAMESLPVSEDSDTTRIYDVKTMETRFEKPKPLSPDTVRFFAPKPIPTFPVALNRSASLNKDKPDSPTVVQRSPAKLESDLVNRLAIEEDVVPKLPSVKQLAGQFAKHQNTVVPQSLHRPKSLNAIFVPKEAADEGLQRSDKNELIFNKKLASIRNGNNSHAFKPGYSITGRSLSNQFKEQLKQLTTTPDVPANSECGQRGEETAMTDGVPKSPQTDGRQSPERPPSPVLAPGSLKNNIAFYENLKRQV